MVKVFCLTSLKQGREIYPVATFWMPKNPDCDSHQ